MSTATDFKINRVAVEEGFSQYMTVTSLLDYRPRYLGVGYFPPKLDVAFLPTYSRIRESGK